MQESKEKNRENKWKVGESQQVTRIYKKENQKEILETKYIVTGINKFCECQEG